MQPRRTKNRGLGVTGRGQRGTNLKNKFLLAQDDMERTAWHMATKMGNSEILKKLWAWSKEKLNTDELKNNVLLA